MDAPRGIYTGERFMAQDSRPLQLHHGVGRREHRPLRRRLTSLQQVRGEGQQLKATSGCSCRRSSWPSWDFEADDVPVAVGEPKIYDPAKEGAWLTLLPYRHLRIGARPASLASTVMGPPTLPSYIFCADQCG